MAQGSLKVWATAVLVVLGACTEPRATPTPPAPTRPAPTRAPPPAGELAPRRPQSPSASNDACGASDLQSLVGKPRTEIPIPVLPSRRRVICSTCPMTQDYVPYRQTIIYDANTGRVKTVKCG
jgi:hypothetical protein